MPEIVRDLASIREEHARLSEALSTGELTPEQARILAERDDELTRFHALCMGTPPFRLYATGILPADELRHPASAAAGRATTDSRIEIEGEVMTLMEATRRLAVGRVGRGPALGDWTARGIRIGDPMGLWPAARVQEDDHAGDTPGDAPTPDAATKAPVNLEFHF